MAGVALSLLTQAPALISMVGDLVHSVEKLFGHGKGADKKQAVMTGAGDLLNLYAASAPLLKLSGAGTSDVTKALDNLVEAIVQFYNATGHFVHSQ